MHPQKEAFFGNLEAQGLAVTYDDVRLRTVNPHENVCHPELQVTAATADTTSHFSRRIELSTPIVSSPMDTVTGSKMAIAMAKLGGLGIIHAAFGVREQRDKVRRVKLHLNGLIEKPITIRPDMTVEQVENMKRERDFEFSTFPVIGANEKLVGMFTQADLDFCQEKSDAVEAHMTPLENVVYSEASVTPQAAFNLMRQHGKLNTLPLLNKDGTVAGLYVKSDVKRLIEDNPENFSLDANGRLLVGAAVPTDPDEALARIEAMGDYVDVLVIDTANGNSQYLFATLETVKKHTDIDVVAGNVSEGSSAYLLAQAGADGIRVGQGGGSICTTRKETGIGTPQVTAVYNCARAVESFNIPVCADGGLKDKGDIPIAFAAGAHTVMMGNMLAATKESPGKLVDLGNGTQGMEYRGMGSPSALRDNLSSRKRYSSGGPGVILPEGVETILPYKGSVYEVLPKYAKALRKAMEYVVAPDIASLREGVLLNRITDAGLRESHPHDL